jgi:hypothetical protein
MKMVNGGANALLFRRSERALFCVKNVGIVRLWSAAVWRRRGGGQGKKRMYKEDLREVEFFFIQKIERGGEGGGGDSWEEGEGKSTCALGWRVHLR